MSQTISNNQSYTYSTHVRPFQHSSRDYTATVYSVFCFSIATLLIVLAMRLMLSLMVISNPLTHGLTIVTDPFVMPFNHAFNDAHSMVQGSTALAFSSYFFLYWVGSLISRIFQRTSEYFSAHS